MAFLCTNASGYPGDDSKLKYFYAQVTFITSSFERCGGVLGLKTFSLRLKNSK